MLWQIRVPCRRMVKPSKSLGGMRSVVAICKISILSCFKNRHNPDWDSSRLRSYLFGYQNKASGLYFSITVTLVWAFFLLPFSGILSPAPSGIDLPWSALIQAAVVCGGTGAMYGTWNNLWSNKKVLIQELPLVVLLAEDWDHLCLSCGSQKCLEAAHGIFFSFRLFP